MNESMPDALTQGVGSLERGQRYARRNPWVAGFFSFVLDGLGQLYNGQATKGLLLYALSWEWLYLHGSRFCWKFPPPLGTLLFLH